MPWNNLNKMWIEEGEQQIANNTTRDNLVEALNHDEYEEIHKDSLEKLRSVFPEIPEDLTHIYVRILYEWKGDDGERFHYYLSVGNEEIIIKNRDDRYFMRSNGPEEPRSCFSDTECRNRDGRTSRYKREFNRSEFESRLKQFIDNADKCEWIIQTRDWEKFTYKDFLWNDVYWYDADKKFK